MAERKHITLIEAERDFANILKNELTKRGFEVDIFPNGDDGLDFIKKNTTDLIVLCVELPETSGYSICNKLKKDNKLKSIPLILISSEATPETFEQHKKLKTHAE
ncbi:MAG: response regulator, partial [Deltaproteobacteria bacterium]|nr:response regulator [Deltaproteobacteria bacterium]